MFLRRHTYPKRLPTTGFGAARIKYFQGCVGLISRRASLETEPTISRRAAGAENCSDGIPTPSPPTAGRREAGVKCPPERPPTLELDRRRDMGPLELDIPPLRPRLQGPRAPGRRAAWILHLPAAAQTVRAEIKHSPRGCETPTDPGLSGRRDK